MSDTFSGSGEALVVHDNNDGVRPFSSVYAFRSVEPSGTFSVVDYQNSVIGRRKLSSVFTNRVTGSTFRDYASDGLLNFVTGYFRTTSGISVVIVTITGVYNKCNYSSIELDRYIGITSTTSKSVNNDFEKRSMSEDEFNLILEAHPFLRKKYDEIISKK
jgi:hypothetical protein